MKSSEKFFFKGKKDFYKTETTGDRVHEVTNPYNSETFRGKEWQRGYNAAYFQNKDKADSGKFRTYRKKSKKV